LINGRRYMLTHGLVATSSQYVYTGRAYSSPYWCHSHPGLNPRVASHISTIQQQPEATLACIKKQKTLTNASNNGKKWIADLRYKGGSIKYRKMQLPPRKKIFV
jgi:hypothetical protein